jgi:hypothetical protein
MFDHQGFLRYSFNHVPLDTDLYLMDEKWMQAFEQDWLQQLDGTGAASYGVGYASPAAARSVGDSWLEMSWYVNIINRFHEVPVFLPKSAFVTCIDVANYDEKPHLFVRSNWLTELHERPLATFAIVDAAGVKTLLQSGKLPAKALHALRDRIDAIGARHPELGFISFADSLLVKQVWSVGHIEGQVRYTYEPEALFPVIAELHRAIEQELGTGAYTVMTQGINSYDDPLALHVSARQNHVSLNSLGVPFAQLLAIDSAARKASKAKVHAKSELYVDSMLFRSLNLKYEFDRTRQTHWPYQSPMTHSVGATYVATSISTIVDNLRPPEAG